MPTTEVSQIPVLPHPYTLHVRAASGWLDLGNAAEASNELALIPEERRLHPAVLAMKWEILASLKCWEEAVDVARSLEQLCPDVADAWVKHAFALHELGNTQNAWDTLQHTLDQFPENYIIPYNLACYACQMGREADTVEMLKAAIKIAGKATIKNMALGDSDLKPMWPQIRKL